MRWKAWPPRTLAFTCWLGFAFGTLLACGTLRVCGQDTDDAAPRVDEVAHPDPQRWEETIETMAAQRPSLAGDGVTCFIGSSSIRMWPLDRWFPNHQTVNRGFGGSMIADATHYLPQLVVPHRPQVVVLYSGDNDIAHGLTPAQVADDYGAFVRALRRELPKVKLVYVSIKPSLARWDQYPRMADANAQIHRQIESDPQATYLDIATPMLGDDGKPRAELFVSDGLHLNEHGYELWAELVQPHLP